MFCRCCRGSELRTLVTRRTVHPLSVGHAAKTDGRGKKAAQNPTPKGDLTMSRINLIVTVTAAALYASTSFAAIGKGYDLTQPAGVSASATATLTVNGNSTLGYCPDLTPRDVTADVNLDGQITADDWFAWLDYYFQGSKVADCNRDGFVNSDDIFEFLNLWVVALAGGEVKESLPE
jgi:hypothetical protein